MAKLTFRESRDWQNYNFLAKQLFDFVNVKLNATVRTYIGDGTSNRIITIDIIPSFILIAGHGGDDTPIFWLSTFENNFSKDILGNLLLDGILGVTPKKDGFIIGNNSFVNFTGETYSFMVLGN